MHTRCIQRIYDFGLSHNIQNVYCIFCGGEEDGRHEPDSRDEHHSMSKCVPIYNSVRII